MVLLWLAFSLTSISNEINCIGLEIDVIAWILFFLSLKFLRLGKIAAFKTSFYIKSNKFFLWSFKDSEVCQSSHFNKVKKNGSHKKTRIEKWVQDVWGTCSCHNPKNELQTVNHLNFPFSSSFLIIVLALSNSTVLVLFLFSFFLSFTLCLTICITTLFRLIKAHCLSRGKIPDGELTFVSCCTHLQCSNHGQGEIHRT